MELSGGGLKRQHKRGTKLRHFLFIMAAGHMVRRQIYTHQVPAERMHHRAQPLGHKFIPVGAVAQS